MAVSFLVTQGRGTVNTDATTAIGDIVLVFGYFEPANMGTGTATYGTPVVSGLTAVTNFPVSSNDANLTTANTFRFYCYYGYATANGAQGFAYSGNTTSYDETMVVVVKGTGVTSGSPFADTPVVAGAVNQFPSVSVTPAANNTTILFAAANFNGTHYDPTSPFAVVSDLGNFSTSSYAQSTAASVTVASSGTQMSCDCLLTFPLAGGAPLPLPELVTAQIRR